MDIATTINHALFDARFAIQSALGHSFDDILMFTIYGLISVHVLYTLLTIAGARRKALGVFLLVAPALMASTVDNSSWYASLVFIMGIPLWYIFAEKRILDPYRV